MIEIDDCHIAYIAATIRCLKPNAVLELGYGTGKTTAAILTALRANRYVRATFTVVDNFLDWGGVKPSNMLYDNYELIVSSERDFVLNSNRVFDVIVADADHNGTDKIVDELINMLTPGGVIFFHDVTNPMFPNLATIKDKLPGSWLFNTSEVGEECWRGLLCHKKPDNG